MSKYVEERIKKLEERLAELEKSKLPHSAPYRTQQYDAPRMPDHTLDIWGRDREFVCCDR